VQHVNFNFRLKYFCLRIKIFTDTVMEFYLWRHCGDGVVSNGDGALMEFILKFLR